MRLYKTLRYVLSHPLNRQHKFRALRRFVQWQFASRMLGRPVILPFVRDSVLVVENGMTGATGNWYCGLHEFQDMAFVLHLLRPDDLFVDIGANVGSYTVLASKVAGSQSISIEPVPSTFQKLTRNIRVNDLQDRVNLLPCAVGREQGQIQFSIDQDTANQVVADNYSGKSLAVPVRTLDDILSGLAPTCWKVDVEGYEEAVLEGARESLRCASLQAILLEAHSSSIQRTLEEAGFSQYEYDPPGRTLTAIAGNTPSTRYRHNHLWLRDVQWVRQRCESARPIEVLSQTI